MRTVVLVKSAVDEAELRADQGGRPVLKGAATKLSNFDRIGVEEALRQREAHSGTVTVLSLGGPESRKAVREALAMGGDDAVLVVSEQADGHDALGTAYLLSKAIRRREVDLILCSEGSSDTYQAQVGAMLAEYLGLPFLAYVRNLVIRQGKATCEQVFEEASLVSEFDLPAVVSMVNGANKPRYPTLVQVMAAGKKSLEEVSASLLKGADYPETGFLVEETTLQSQVRKRVIFEGPPGESAEKLVEALRQGGLV